MKHLVLASLMIASSTAFASELQGGGHVGIVKITGAGCNSRDGIGEVEYIQYNKDKKQFEKIKTNVVNERLCKKNSQQEPSKLVDIAMWAVLGGPGISDLYKVTSVNPSVVVNIEPVNNEELKKETKVFSRYNLLDLNEYPVYDFRTYKVGELPEGEIH